VTKTTTVGPDGTSKTEVQEKIEDNGRSISDKRYMDDGSNNSKRFLVFCNF
jgi:hypothetical protein